MISLVRRGHGELEGPGSLLDGDSVVMAGGWVASDSGAPSTHQRNLRFYILCRLICSVALQDIYCQLLLLYRGKMEDKSLKVPELVSGRTRIQVLTLLSLYSTLITLTIVP